MGGIVPKCVPYPILENCNKKLAFMVIPIPLKKVYTMSLLPGYVKSAVCCELLTWLV